jgi:DNA-binding NarL/FixJ family response regulator
MKEFNSNCPARVLIADDHPIFRQGLRLVIETNDHVEVVAEAENGESALVQIRFLKPDLVFLDIAMPDQDGLSVLETLRQEKNPIRVIMMTSYPEQAYLNRAMELDVSGYLLKDNSRDDIGQCLSQVLQGGTYISPSFSQGNLCVPRDLSGHDDLQEVLTDKELQVLSLVARFMTSKEIARHLNISFRTVQNHRAHISQKLGLRGIHQLSRFARRNLEFLRQFESEE